MVTLELGDVTLNEQEGVFTLQPLSLMPYEKKDNVWVSVTLERSLDIKELQRTTYNTFDFVSDVGGLSGALLSFFTIIVSVWNFNSMDNTMASQLYIQQDENGKTRPIALSKMP